MKVGELVKKIAGDSDLQEVGVVLEINTSSLQYTILTVNTKGKIKTWYAPYVKVINLNEH